MDDVYLYWAIQYSPCLHITKSSEEVVDTFFSDGGGAVRKQNLESVSVFGLYCMTAAILSHALYHKHSS